MKKVVLKSGKEKPLRHRHHWIFSGAIAQMPAEVNGECLPVYSADQALLGCGYFNSKAKITGRMLSFDETPVHEAVQSHLQKAVDYRCKLFEGKETNAYRLVNGEGDLLPGLVVDKYKDILVIQISTLGMRCLRPLIVEWLVKHVHPSCIYEKSLLPARKEEGLGDEQGILFGHAELDNVEIKENGLRFIVSVIEGQKTGFFLDHREMRYQTRQLAAGKRVLNCFSYTGGFSVYAAAGGAVKVDSVDISTRAVKMAEANMQLNGFSSLEQGFFVQDVFEFLRERPLDYELVILDPPAFAKKKKDLIPACRGYKDINRIALKKMAKQSILLTSSCSYHVDEILFQKIVFQAAVEAGRTVKIVGKHCIAADHPINICHPESDYLKSLVLYVE